MSIPEAVSLVNGAAPEPSAFITQRFALPEEILALLPSKARDDRNATLLPLGDQVGFELDAPKAVILVNGVAAEPSAFTIQMLSVAFVLEELLPSSARAEAKPTIDADGDGDWPGLPDEV